MESVFKKKYLDEIVPFLMKESGYKNINEVPKIEKIVLNMGLGEAIQNPKLIETAIEELSNIACQKAVPRSAKKSISNFKLREGMKIGVSVTLRKQRMYEFLLRFINIALPRMRDFRGISPKAFDGKGNYNMGIKEQIVFPEIDYDRIDKIRGFNISIVTTAKTDKEGHALLSAFGMPFRN